MKVTMRCTVHCVAQYAYVAQIAALCVMLIRNQVTLTLSLG